MFQHHGHGQSGEAFREHTGRPTDGRHSIELPETGKARAKMGPGQSTVFGQEPKSDRHISGEVPEAQVSGFEVNSAKPPDWPPTRVQKFCAR